MLIHEDNCEVSLPSPVEDRYIQPQGVFRNQTSSAALTGFGATIHITRLYAELLQALKSGIIHVHVLQDFDTQFRSKSLLLPEAYQTGSNAALEAAALPPIITLLSAQFLLCRRNLTPSCRTTERSDALSRCTLIAQDTAKYISRTLHNAPEPELEKSWHVRVRPIASNMLCMHTWRCVLILCFRGDYDAALVCLHLMTAVGNLRAVNGACGRNLGFFLDRLLERIRSGHGNFQTLERDEEMMAYVSGDAQGSLEQSWVWAGVDLTSSTSPQPSSRSIAQPRGLDESMRDALPLQPNVQFTGKL